MVQRGIVLCLSRGIVASQRNRKMVVRISHKEFCFKNKGTVTATESDYVSRMRGYRVEVVKHN